jgi:hypothetical protein
VKLRGFFIYYSAEHFQEQGLPELFIQAALVGLILLRTTLWHECRVYYVLHSFPDKQRHVYNIPLRNHNFGDFRSSSIVGITSLVVMDGACAEGHGHREDRSDIGAGSTGSVGNREKGIGMCRYGEAGVEFCTRRSMGIHNNSLCVTSGNHIFGDFRGGIVVGISWLVKMDRAYTSCAGHREGSADVVAYTRGAVDNREIRRIANGRDGETGQVRCTRGNVRGDLDGLIALANGEGLLDLRGGVVIGIPRLVSIDLAGANCREGHHSEIDRTNGSRAGIDRKRHRVKGSAARGSWSIG